MTAGRITGKEDTQTTEAHWPAAFGSVMTHPPSDQPTGPNVSPIKWQVVYNICPPLVIINTGLKFVSETFSRF